MFNATVTGLCFCGYDTTERNVDKKVGFVYVYL